VHIDHLFQLDRSSNASLQKQIVEQITNAIIDGHIPLDKALPSCRLLAKQLNVSRNTTILAYERLRTDGYLLSQERKGYFVNQDILAHQIDPKDQVSVESSSLTPDWESRFVFNSKTPRTPDRVLGWQQYKYPFISGQISFDLFPLNQWRECCRDANNVEAVKKWSHDQFDIDDEHLIEQIHTRLLPRRGVKVDKDQILVTVGAQQSLFMLCHILLGKERFLGIENPGYHEILSIASMVTEKIIPLAIDDFGLQIGKQLDECDYIYVTPSHQSPTTVTMPLKARRELLDRAVKSDYVLIEDDTESELNFKTSPHPALKSLDVNDRVIYIGSMSKTIAPGLRMGYIVAPKPLLNQLRALRRLMVRHLPTNNQHAMALFLARGYHDSLLRRVHSTYQERSDIVFHAIKKYLPEFKISPTCGGSSLWLQGPEDIDTRVLAGLACKKGVYIQPGGGYFFDKGNIRQNYLKLGFSAIDQSLIEQGLIIVAECMKEMREKT
jgi:GntR family transcriptional regulator/MocR family aminotransferase